MFGTLPRSVFVIEYPLIHCLTTLEKYLGTSLFCKSVRISQVSRFDSILVPLQESHTVHNRSVISQAYLVIGGYVHVQPQSSCLLPCYCIYEACIGNTRHIRILVNESRESEQCQPAENNSAQVLP